jgi:ribosomal protein L40E
LLDPGNEEAQKGLQNLSISPAKQTSYLICPMCGFPNNVSDTQCKRCHTSLQNVVRTRTISRPVTISSVSDLTTPSSTMETPPDLNQILEQKKSALVKAQENKSDWRYRNAAIFVLFLFGLFRGRRTSLCLLLLKTPCRNISMRGKTANPIS